MKEATENSAGSARRSEQAGLRRLGSQAWQRLVWMSLLVTVFGFSPEPGGSPSARSHPGTLWGWGFGGAGTFIAYEPGVQTEPQPLGPLPELVSVAAGDSHVLALATDGTVWAWGQNSFGATGELRASECFACCPGPAPVSLPPETTWSNRVTQLAAGGHHSLLLRDDGTVWAWGANQRGQLGVAEVETCVAVVPCRHTPAPVVGPSGEEALTGIIAISAGSDHSLALRRDGKVWAWGGNYGGQLGVVSEERCPDLVDMQCSRRHLLVSGPDGQGQLEEIIGISAGAYYSLAVRRDGTVWAWGTNGTGKLGDGTFTDRPYPVRVSGLSEVSVVEAGFGHSLAIRTDGTVLSWGDGAFGELGSATDEQCSYGTTCSTRPLPVQLPGEEGLLTGVTAVATGSFYSMALRADGTLWSWGANRLGTLGDGTQEGRDNPVIVPRVRCASAIAAGPDYSLAIAATIPEQCG
jgi:alpha-tubulin suppressor-like RCC1 family protein